MLENLLQEDKQNSNLFWILNSVFVLSKTFPGNVQLDRLGLHYIFVVSLDYFN